MPARTRHAPAGATGILEADEQQKQGIGLRFKDPLSWRAGKAIPVADLLSRLQNLFNELRQLEQEELERPSLTKVSQELANGHLLGHRDKGVRAWAACCVVEILRLCAPDAPFTGPQLKVYEGTAWIQSLKLTRSQDIFTTFVTSIIPSLADPSNAYNLQHVHVLNSLAEVKSIILLTDLDSADTLILPLFTSCFDIVSGSSKTSTGEELARNVEYDMTRLLVTVIDESTSLAPEVVDIIIAQFLRVDARTTSGKKSTTELEDKQDTLLLKEYPPAYNMSKAICTACPEKMTSWISQYFNNVIIDASGPSKTNAMAKSSSHRRVSVDDSEEETEDVKELSKAHRLMRELWRACPDVLQNVIPQLEAELSAESVSLRLLATETLGDLAAGIGVAGLPPQVSMDPAAYPPLSLQDSLPLPQTNVLLTPMSPKPFSQAHSTAYNNFLSRRQDRSANVRAAWVTAIGRVLLTSAGGLGMSEAEGQKLQAGLAQMLQDADERVRSAAIKVVGSFGLADVIAKLGVNGGVSKPDSVLGVLADRVKDRKHIVREKAMNVLGRIWGTAAGEIEQGNEQVISVIGDIPSKLLAAYYTNDSDIYALLDRVLFELLLPLGYPPLKSKVSKSGKKGAQNGDEDEGLASDKIRTGRILTFVRSLDEKSRPVFFAIQKRQVDMAKIVRLYLDNCEAYNGGVIEGDEEAIKASLTKTVDYLSKSLPDSSRISVDLWKFAKLHDRRNYQLMRYSMAVESEYRTTLKAIKELSKRIQGSSAPAILDTLTPLLYRCSLLVYNRSHIPSIMEFSRTDENGLSNIAHEMLKEIASRNPEILKSHVQEMCKDLEAEAPSATKKSGSGSEEALKACAGFARKFASEIPKDRKFLVAMTDYALYSPAPKAAKHAVSILLAAAEKKEMYAKDLLQKCTSDCKFGSPYFLTRLATISQLNLLAPTEAEGESDAIVDIAIQQTLLNNRSLSTESDAYTWSAKADDETVAKEWALKILVNSIRAKRDMTDRAVIREVAEPVYRILETLVTNEGELRTQKDTPGNQKPRLRLIAAKLLLKLCHSRRVCEDMLSPSQFNSIALVAQDTHAAVRAGFVNQLKKYLGQNKLNHRWYTILFLLPFEPDAAVKNGSLTWLRSRASFFARQQAAAKLGQSHQNVMEGNFARLLSLLAHHPDYPSMTSENFTSELLDFARYIIFYLSAIANDDNMSLVFHIAQRVKQTQDCVATSPAQQQKISQHLYALSDLAQATIRNFAEIYSHQKGHGAGTNMLQTWPGKLRLPSQLFAALPSHDVAQSIADKSFLSDDATESLEKLVKSVMKESNSSQGQGKSKKRSSDELTGKETGSAIKKQKKTTTTLPVRKAKAETKTPKEERKSDEVPESERRRSGRRSGGAVSYAESEDDEDHDVGIDNDLDEPVDEEKNASEPEEQAKFQQNGEKHDAMDLDDDVDEDKDRVQPSVRSSPLAKKVTPLKGNAAKGNASRGKLTATKPKASEKSATTRTRRTRTGTGDE